MCGNSRRIFARVAKLCDPAKYNETLYIARLGAKGKSHFPRLEIVKSPKLLAPQRRVYVYCCMGEFVCVHLTMNGEYANAKNNAVG